MKVVHPRRLELLGDRVERQPVRAAELHRCAQEVVRRAISRPCPLERIPVYYPTEILFRRIPTKNTALKFALQSDSLTNRMTYELTGCRVGRVKTYLGIALEQFTNCSFIGTSSPRNLRQGASFGSRKRTSINCMAANYSSSARPVPEGAGTLVGQLRTQ